MKHSEWKTKIDEARAQTSAAYDQLRPLNKAEDELNAITERQYTVRGRIGRVLDPRQASVIDLIVRGEQVRIENPSYLNVQDLSSEVLLVLARIKRWQEMWIAGELDTLPPSGDVAFVIRDFDDRVLQAP